MKRANWLIAATLALMMFVQPNKTNAAFGNGSLSGTYRGLATGSFWSASQKFDFVYTTTFTFNGKGNAVETDTYTQQGTFGPVLIGPCDDAAACTYEVNHDGTGTAACTNTSSTCGDTGGTWRTAFTTDGDHIYFIITEYKALQALSVSGTLVKDGFYQ